MSASLDAARARANAARYRPGQRAGHYESFFQRANHPDRPLAFWIRYTLFSPEDRPEAAMGELWAVFFDGERNRHWAVKREVPMGDCRFDGGAFSVRVGEAVLGPGHLKGAAASGGHHLSWQLTFDGAQPPLFLLPLGLYNTGFPKAKSLVGLPLARYRGFIAADDRRIEIDDWVGSQNHNWGRRHTDHYAWGQVAGFDTHPESFLEVATARIRIGRGWSPFLTTLVLRHRGGEIRLNSLPRMLTARGSFCYFLWSFRSEDRRRRVEGTISAPREAFVGLNYLNPPGGEKHCLNTKIAACEIRVTDKRGGGTATPDVLFTRHRAAFEILTDERDHGVAIQA